MHTEIYKCLEQFGALPAFELHQINQNYRHQLAHSEWFLSVTLLASDRGRLHRKLEKKYPDVIAYAQAELNLAREKTLELLSTARAFENLPLLSDAFREGKLSWSKVRELKRVATPETEQVWCEYALTHTLPEVRRRVAMSPTEWKRGKALAASIEGQPTATTAKVNTVLTAPMQQSLGPMTPELESPENSTQPCPTSPSGPDENNDVAARLPAPKFIKVVHYLTPDEFAVYEQARKRVCSRHNKTLRREAVLLEWCDSELSGGTARARARHQVLIHTNGDEAWYETDRGLLQADPELVKNTSEAGREIELPAAASVGESRLPKGVSSDESIETQFGSTGILNETSRGKSAKKGGRLSNKTTRIIFARAGNRCECCGRGGCQLDGHHIVAVSDGGSDEPENLLVLCKLCHALMHEEDFEQRLDWLRARARALKHGSWGSPREEWEFSDCVSSTELSGEQRHRHADT